MVNCLSEAYATDGVIAEAEAETVNFKQPVGLTDVCSSELLWEEALSRCLVYDKAKLKGIFI